MKKGEIIRNYELIEQIGSGIAGEVWKAKSTGAVLNKMFALKFIAEKEFINFEVFRKEANIWNKACEKNPKHIAYLHDAFECKFDSNKKYYVIVIEYVSGGSLQSLIEERLRNKVKFSIEEVKKIIGGILLGLIEIQSVGIVHRDIKPANIVIDNDGEPKLIDFGLSTQFDLEQSHVPRGTPFYMSPEAFLGGRSFQSDIWSVGVIFYLLLADRLPFPKSSNKEELTRDKLNIIISTEGYEPLPTYLPIEFDNILKKSLNKVVDERYKTAQEMYDDIMCLPEVEPSKIEGELQINDNGMNDINEDITKPFPLLHTQKTLNPTPNFLSSIPKPYLLLGGIFLLSIIVLGAWWFLREKTETPTNPSKIVITPNTNNPIEIKLATSWSSDLRILHEKVVEMASEIERKSDGKIKIEVLSSGKAKDSNGNVISPLELFDPVAKGTDIHMAHTSAYYHKEIKGSAFFSAVPFGKDKQRLRVWLSEEGMSLWKELYNKRGVEPFECGHSGPQKGGWFKKEVKSVKDFKDLKIRMVGLGAEVLTKLDARVVRNIPPTKEAFAEAAKNNDVDVIEWIGPYHDYEFGLNVLFNYYYEGWQEPNTMFELIINKKFYDSLPEELREIIKKEVASCNANISLEFETKNPQYEKYLKKYFRYFSSDIKEELTRQTRVVIDEYVGDDTEVKKIRDSYVRDEPKLKPKVESKGNESRQNNFGKFGKLRSPTPSKP